MRVELKGAEGLKFRIVAAAHVFDALLKNMEQVERIQEQFNEDAYGLYAS